MNSCNYTLFNINLNIDKSNSSDSLQKLETLLKNIENSFEQEHIDLDSLKDMALRALCINPYSIEVYTMLFILFPDPKNELQTLANKFGLLDEFNQEILNDFDTDDLIEIDIYTIKKILAPMETSIFNKITALSAVRFADKCILPIITDMRVRSIIYKFLNRIQYKYNLNEITNYEPIVKINNITDATNYGNKLISNYANEDLMSKIDIFINNNDINKRIFSAISNYANLEDNEIPIFCYDDTVFKSGKNGLLATNKGLYVHNQMSNTKKLLYSDIYNIQLDGIFNKEIIIDGFKLTTSLISGNSVVLLFNILNDISIDLSSNMYQSTNFFEKDSSPKEFVDSVEKILNVNESTNDTQKYMNVFSTEPRIMKKFQNIISSYASIDSDEITLFCYDNTVMGSAKDGFLITSKAVYIHNMFQKTIKILLKDINSIELRGILSKNLFINNFEVTLNTISDSKSKNILCTVTNQIIDTIKSF